MSIKFKTQLQIPTPPQTDDEVARKAEVDKKVDIGYKTTTTDYNANSTIIEAVKLFLKGAGTITNFPIAKPLFFTSEFDSEKSIVLQTCLDASGTQLYIRTGTVTVVDDDYTVTWGTWQQLSSGQGGGGAAPQRDTLTLADELEAGSNLTVPAYTKGAGTLFVYMNGLLLEEGVEYSEIGTTDQESTTLVFSDTLPAGTRMSFILY